jgi:L,D-transpeptidase catalytic domain
MKKANSKGQKIKSVRKTALKKQAAKNAPPKQRATPTGKALKIPVAGPLQERLALAKKIEASNRPKAEFQRATRKAPAADRAPRPQRNGDFPNTYIQTISVRLEDPDHPVTLSWTGPNASAQETGPYRSSPGAGLRGLNCDATATSRRAGSHCTPKGTFSVTGFASQLNSHPEAKDVTWFVPARGIALHYYPSVPKYAASHGCVRLETRRVAQLIQNNSRAGITQVIVDGTWTKPPHQY